VTSAHGPAGASATDLREPGDFAVCKISGLAGTGIKILQLLDHGGYKDWEHALAYVGGGMCLQAEPGGARIIKRPVQSGDLWSTGLAAFALTTEQQARVPALAETYRGTGYSYLDYEAIFLHRLHFPDLALWPGPRGSHVTLQAFIKSTGHEMCSALVDNFRLRLGSRLFVKPPRWEGYVKPYDLGLLLAGAGAVPVP